MKIFLAFVALLAAAQAAPTDVVNPIGLPVAALIMEPFNNEAIQVLRSPSSRIVGGTPASPGQIPYVARLVIDSRALCTGSLISSKWVLTARHCVSSTSIVHVTLGSTDISAQQEGVVVVESSRVILHPEPERRDIALVELAEEVAFSSTVQPVKLATDHSIDYAGATARTSGFGTTSVSTRGVDVLYYVDVKVITNEQCMKYYGFNIGDEGMCTQELNPNVIGNACSGDSGGPVVDIASGRQIGVTSYGSSAGCESGAPQGQTRVSNFIDWIESNTGLSL